MNRAKKLGRKIVKARESQIPRGVTPTKPTGGSSAPKANFFQAGSPMGFGKGYKQTYAESHVHGEPTKALRRYRKRKAGTTTTATSA